MNSEDQTNEMTEGQQNVISQENNDNNQTDMSGVNQDNTEQSKNTESNTDSVTNGVNDNGTVDMNIQFAPNSEFKATESAAPVVLEAPKTEPTLVQQANIQPTALVVETPSVEEKGPVEISAFDQYVNKIKESGTVAEKKLVEAIEHYIDAMQPGKPVEPNQGARNQYSFWRVIYNVVEKSNQEEFKPLWKILLAYFNQYNKRNDVFYYRYVNRFSEFWVNGEDELRAYQKIINVMGLTCDPESRSKNMKQFDMNRTFDVGFTEVGRSRLIQFYQG